MYGHDVGGAWVQVLLNAILVTEPPTRLELHLDPCLPPSYGIDAEVLRAAVELESLGETLDQRATVAVTCAPEGLSLVRSSPGATLERTLALERVDPAIRARVLALAIVELAVQSNPAPEVPDAEPAKPPPIPVPVPVTPSTERAPASPWSLSLGPSARLFVPSTWLVGGRLGVHHYPRPHLGWSGAVEIGGARYSSTLGDVSALAISGTLGLFGYRDVVHRLRLSGGAGAIAGWSQMRGNAQADALGGRLRGPWFGPVGNIRLDVFVAPQWSVGLDAEVGYALVGVRALANDAAIAGVTGLWVGGNLHVSWTVPRRP